MTKKVHIIAELLPETSETSFNQIEETIRTEAKIPFCTEIKKVKIDDIDESYRSLKMHGVSGNVAKNIIDLYTE